MSHAVAVALHLVVAAAVAAAVRWRGRSAYEGPAGDAAAAAALAGAPETLAEHRYVAESGGPSRLLPYHPRLDERIEGYRGASPGSRTG